MSLENIMLSKRNQLQKIINCRTHLYKMPGTGNPTEMATRFLAA